MKSIKLLNTTPLPYQTEVITVYRHDSCYLADVADIDNPEDTLYTVPLPFRRCAPIRDVLADQRRINPTAIVRQPDDSIVIVREPSPCKIVDPEFIGIGDIQPGYYLRDDSCIGRARRAVSPVHVLSDCEKADRYYYLRELPIGTSWLMGARS